MDETTRLFVLLLHTLSDKTHWDLCLDLGEVLATWQIAGDPASLSTGGAPLPARRIADHRRAYLDYEGPISGNRGEVRRVDRGTWRLIKKTPKSWRIRLHGARIQGTFELPETHVNGVMQQVDPGTADAGW